MPETPAYRSHSHSLAINLGWFRAIILAYDEECDEAFVRFVDYGGFARVPRVDLRQIR